MNLWKEFQKLQTKESNQKLEKLEECPSFKGLNGKVVKEEKKSERKIWLNKSTLVEKSTFDHLTNTNPEQKAIESLN